MRIIMGLNAPWVGGTRIHALTLAQALLRRGHHLVLVTDPGILEAEMVERGIPYIIRSDSTEAMVRLLLDLVDREHPDVIHAHPAASIFESFLLSHLTGVPFVVTMHGEYLMHFRRDLLGRQVGQAVSQVIAVSDQIKQYLISQSTLDSTKITVIRNGIDFAEYSLRLDTVQVRQELGLRADEKVIMYLGRLDSDKAAAITATADAVNLLHGLGGHVKGVFVGRGDLEGMLRGRKDLILTGFRRDLPRLLSVADVVVATGRSALEALAVGKPVVGAGRAGLHGLITPENWEKAVESNFGDHGFLPQSTSSQLLHHIQRALNQGLAVSMDLHPLVKGLFDLSEIVGQLETVYERVVTKI